MAKVDSIEAQGAEAPRPEVTFFPVRRGAHDDAPALPRGPRPAPGSRREQALERLRVDTEWSDRETYLGTATDLFDAGVLTAAQLAEMESRSARRLTFGPDGRAVSFRTAVPWADGGYLRVNMLRDNEIYVERSLPPLERHERTWSALRSASLQSGTQQWLGSRETLERIGMPPHWFTGLPVSGRRWGQRSFALGNRRVDVSVTYTGFRVRVSDAAQTVVDGASEAPRALARPASALKLVWSR